MAWKLKYRCSQCGYEAEVYEGRGLFRQEIRAVSCPDCKSIQNLVVGGIIADVAPSYSKSLTCLAGQGFLYIYGMALSHEVADMAS